MTYQIEGKFYPPTPNVESLVRENSYGYFTRNVEYHYLDEIRRDGGTQPRSAINLQHVKLLEEQMEDGQQLEPITVFYDGTQYWLADGFHRWHAHRNREEETITCVIHQGSQRDAVLYSVGANSDNKPALPRSQQDKRRAVLTLLNDPEWSTWSDREIARRCRVSDKTVAQLRNSADTKLNIEEKTQLRNSADTKLNIEEKTQLRNSADTKLNIEEKTQLRNSADTKLNIEEKTQLRNSADTKLNIEEKTQLRNSADTKLNIEEKTQLRNSADTKLNIGEKTHLRNSADTKLNIGEKTHLRNSADTKLNIEEKTHLRNSADTKLNIEEKTHLRNSADTKLNIEEKTHLRNSADTKLNIERKAQRGGKTYIINTTNIGRKASTPLQASYVTVKDDHPLFAGQSGRIAKLLHPDAAIVELTDGTREKIQLKYLDVHEEENSYIQIAHHLKLVPGGLIEIHVPTNNKINGRLGRIEAVHESTVSVWVRDVNTMTMQKHTLKHHFVETVPMDREPQLVEVCDRIEKLRQYHLDPFEIEILLLLQRPFAFTPTELEYLAQIERRHGILDSIEKDARS